MTFKTWVFITVGLFALGIVAGLLVPADSINVFTQDLAGLKKLAASLGPFKISTAIFIFVRNASILLLSFVLSPFLCLVPILILVGNAALLSFVSAMVVHQKSLGFLLAGILPHGVFEITAVIIGEAAALSFGVMAMMSLFSAEKRKLLWLNLKENLRYMAVALLLLLPAAVIETYIVPLILT